MCTVTGVVTDGGIPISLLPKVRCTHVPRSRRYVLLVVLVLLLWLLLTRKHGIGIDRRELRGCITHLRDDVFLAAALPSVPSIVSRRVIPVFFFENVLFFLTSPTLEEHP